MTTNSNNMAADIIGIATTGEVDDLRLIASDISQIMVENPDFMNRRNEMGKTALDLAAMLGKELMIEELISNGANVNESTQNGYSALHHAATWGKLQCLRVLVESGADLQLKTSYGERARECAARYNQDECVNYLDRSEARISLKALIQSFKETIADPEKHMGKLNKENRITGNRACDEKNNWMENNKETATLDEIETVVTDLETILQPIFAKLKDQINGV